MSNLRTDMVNELFPNTAPDCANLRERVLNSLGLTDPESDCDPNTDLRERVVKKLLS